MNISIFTNSGNFSLYSNRKNSINSPYLTPMGSDCFIKTVNASPVFCGKKATPKIIKKVEETLKNIDDLHDPYSDVILISSNKFKNFKDKLKKRSTINSTIKLLNGYTEHMFTPEEEVFNLIKEKSKDTNFTNFSDILKDLLPEAKTKLVYDQLIITSSMKEYAKKRLPKQLYHKVLSYIDKTENDIFDDKFRIKPAIEMFEKLYDEIPKKSVVDGIVEMAYKFPSSATSSNAFIVKNAEKSHYEIAEALISPAQSTIEHIKPSAKRGEDSLSNYIVASKRMNNLRGSMSYRKFIKIFPNIPKYTQRYFDDLKNKINRGGLNSISFNITGSKKALFKESKGLINVDISGINQNFFTRISEATASLQELVDHFSNK